MGTRPSQTNQTTKPTAPDNKITHRKMLFLTAVTMVAIAHARRPEQWYCNQQGCHWEMEWTDERCLNEFGGQCPGVRSKEWACQKCNAVHPYTKLECHCEASNSAPAARAETPEPAGLQPPAEDIFTKACPHCTYHNTVRDGQGCDMCGGDLWERRRLTSASLRHRLLCQ